MFLNLGHFSLLINLFKEIAYRLQFCDLPPMQLVCDQQATLYSTCNHFFYEKTKYFEIYNLLCGMLFSEYIVTSFIDKNDRLAQLSIESLRTTKTRVLHATSSEPRITCYS